MNIIHRYCHRRLSMKPECCTCWFQIGAYEQTEYNRNRLSKLKRDFTV